MKLRIQYNNLTDRQTIINANLDKILIEEQNITEGNFLIFSDVKPVEMQLQEQMDNQLTIMEALADIYAALPTQTV